MKKWVLKAIVQKIISFLPFSNKINYLFQKFVTKGILLSEELFLQKLDHGKDHIIHFKKFSTSTMHETALELGTGWYPIVPVALFLCGFNRIITIDQSSLLSEENVKKVIGYFIKYYGQNRLIDILPHFQEDRITHLKKIQNGSLEEILKGLHIEVIIGDAGKSGLPAQSVDFFVSNNTLEHIPKPVIVHIYKEFKRIAKPSAIMSHFIDLTDHFAHFDKSISAFNFLRYSKAQWGWINNGVQYLNRLRVDDFIKIHQETGFEVIEKEYLYADKKHLENLPIHDDYKHLSQEELMVSHCWFVSKPTSV